MEIVKRLARGLVPVALKQDVSDEIGHLETGARVSIEDERARRERRVTASAFGAEDELGVTTGEGTVRIWIGAIENDLKGLRMRRLDDIEDFEKGWGESTG